MQSLMKEPKYLVTIISTSFNLSELGMSHKYNNPKTDSLHQSCPHGLLQDYAVSENDVISKCGQQTQRKTKLINQDLLNVVCDHIECRNKVSWIY